MLSSYLSILYIKPGLVKDMKWEELLYEFATI